MVGKNRSHFGQHLPPRVTDGILVRRLTRRRLEQPPGRVVARPVHRDVPAQQREQRVRQMSDRVTTLEVTSWSQRCA